MKAWNQLSHGVLKIATRNAKYISAKNNIAINSILGYLPNLVCPWTKIEKFKFDLSSYLKNN